MSYAKGFESLENEVRLRELPVEGRIPEWLSGQLLRTGPAKFEIDGHAYNHWFDGLAMLHAFGFDDGRVGYANRFLQSDSYRQAAEAGQPVRAEFGTDPCKSIFKRAMQWFAQPEATDNACVNIAYLAGEYVSMTETPLPVVFDPESLQTRGHLAYDDELPGGVTTAHPHFDFERREVYNYVTELSRTSTYHIYRQAEGSQRRERVAAIDVDDPRYMHSFAMTRQFVILVEFPLVYRPVEMLLSGKSFAEMMRWKPERGTRFQIVDKESGELVGTGEGEACFGFHHVNAFEDSGALIVDLVAYPDASLVERLYLDRLRTGDAGALAGQLRRFRMRRDGRRVQEDQLIDARLELPRINYRERNTRPYRYVWGAGQTPGASFLDRIVRVDIEEKTSSAWHRSGCYPGEPVFVARPEAESEDDGVLLSVVLDGDEGASFLLVLDARTLDEIGWAHVPHHIPFGFHGTYASGAKNKS